MFQQADEVCIGDVVLGLAGRKQGEAMRAEHRLGVSAQPRNELRKTRERGRPDRIVALLSGHGQSGSSGTPDRHWRRMQNIGAQSKYSGASDL
jgi:hypothetical protein